MKATSTGNEKATSTGNEKLNIDNKHFDNVGRREDELSIGVCGPGEVKLEPDSDEEPEYDDCEVELSHSAYERGQQVKSEEEEDEWVLLP